MSRGGKTVGQALAEKIDIYKSYKDSESKFKKLGSKLNDEIKETMSSMGVDEFSSDSYVATVKYSRKETLDEEKAIEVLKKTLSEEQLKTVIKTKEYIDDDSLEKLVYNGDFDISLLEPCKVLGNEVATLRIKKKGGK
jgi:hypothetical protein